MTCLFCTHNVDTKERRGYVLLMNAAQKLTEKLAKMSVEALTDVCLKMNASLEDEAGIILASALGALEAKCSPESFVAFCARLEAA